MWVLAFNCSLGGGQPLARLGELDLEDRLVDGQLRHLLGEPGDDGLRFCHCGLPTYANVAR